MILCAHGYSGNGRDFDRLAAALAERGARVICPDFAGRGRSDRLATGYAFPQFLGDIRALLARERIASVDWIGTSMGGLLGMLLAAQASGPVRSLVMNDVGAWLPAEALSHIARNLHAPQPFATLAQAEAHLRHTHRDWGVPEDEWKRLVRHHVHREADGWYLHYDPRIASIVKPPPYGPGLHFWDAWYRVRCPVLLLRGERSEVFPADVARTMCDIKPAAELFEVPGAGHAPALMSEGEIGLLCRFLALEPRAVRAVSRGTRHEEPARPFPAARPA